MKLDLTTLKPPPQGHRREGGGTGRAGKTRLMKFTVFTPDGDWRPNNVTNANNYHVYVGLGRLDTSGLLQEADGYGQVSGMDTIESFSGQGHLI